MNRLVVDAFYINNFSFYFEKNILNVKKYLEDFSDKNDDKIVNDLSIKIFNVIKTSDILGFSCFECYEEIKNTVKIGIDIKKISVASMAIFLEKYNLKEEVVGVTEGSYSITDEPVNSWDEYFYNVARQTARNSKCLSRRIGAILVKDKCIISTGYNGPPRGIPRCDERWIIDTEFEYTVKTGTDVKGKCPRYVIGFKSGEGIDVCVAAHAEEKDSIMYMTCGIPCVKCMVKIINAGIKELVVTNFDVYDKSSMYLLNSSDINYRLFDFIENS
jgi:dCMP deaminase